MTTGILGHNRQIELIINSIKKNNLPNAWLFFGPKGVGKASLALRVAKLLATLNFDDREIIGEISVNALMEVDLKLSPQNFYYCQRQKEDKKGKINKHISIDDIRKMQKFFSLTSADKTYRTCIIDSTQDLNIQASNALLKILEEPPDKTLFILICNNIQSVIPTIASRCQKLQFQKLDETTLKELACNIFENQSIETKKKAQLIKLSDGSPGKLFLSIEEEFLSILGKLELIISEFPDFDYDKIHSLISEHPNYLNWEDHDRSILSIYLTLIAYISDKLIEPDSVSLIAKEEKIIGKLNKIPRVQLLIAHLYSQLIFLRSEAITFNLDPKRILFLSFSLFEKLEN